MGQYLRGSTLPANLRAMDVETWEALNGVVQEFAAPRQMERGRTVQVDFS